MTIGAFVMFIGLAVLSVGITALVADQVLRNDDGYLTSPTRTFTTSSYALVSTTLDINGTSGPDNLYPRDLLGDVRVRVTPHRSDQDVFVGIARRDDLRSLLKDTAYTSVTHIGEKHVVYVQHRGGKPAQPWDNSTIWSTTSSGTGTQSVVWPEQDGDWVVLVANTNGSAGLDVDADIGATLPHLTGLAIGLIIGGLLSMALGLAMILAATSRASAPPAPPAPQVPEPRIPVPQ